MVCEHQHARDGAARGEADTETLCGGFVFLGSCFSFDSYACVGEAFWFLNEM